MSDSNTQLLVIVIILLIVIAVWMSCKKKENMQTTLNTQNEASKFLNTVHMTPELSKKLDVCINGACKTEYNNFIQAQNNFANCLKNTNC